MKKTICCISILLIGLMVVSGGCNKAESESGRNSTESKKIFQEENVSLEHWNGTWNSLSTYLETEDQLGIHWSETYSSQLVSCRIRKDNVSIFDMAQPSTGEAMGDLTHSISYEYVGKVLSSDGDEWYQFQSAENSPYQFLILQAVEDHGELHYFFFRFGEEGFMTLLENINWTPIMINYNATVEQLEDVLF